VVWGVEGGVVVGLREEHKAVSEETAFMFSADAACLRAGRELTLCSCRETEDSGSEECEAAGFGDC
jgi:hypothetical protein